MTIEDIIDFDKNNLNPFKPTGLKFQKKSSLQNNITIIICVSIFIIYFICIMNKINNHYLCLILLIPSSIKLYSVAIFYKCKTEAINKSYMIKYKLKMNKNSYFFLDPKDLSNIKYRLLTEFISSLEIKISKEDISKIIEALKYEISVPKFHYRSLTIITTLFTLLVSTALTWFIKPGNSINDIFRTLTECSIMLLVLSFLVLGIERVIIKDFLSSKRNRYQRLIRVLENCSLNIKQG